MENEIKLTRAGILLGSLVPITATLADLYWNDLSLSLGNLILLYQKDYLLWIILTTPIAIGLVFHYFARKVKVHEDELIADRNRNHEELNTLEEFIFDIESGDFSERHYHFNDQRLAGILASLKGKLIRQKDEDEKAKWVAEGHARFGEIFRGTSDLRKLSDEVLKNLVKIMNGNQGSVFILNNQNTEKPFLELTACYAYERKKYEMKSIEPGEGLVGQCYLEKDTIVMTQVPDHYVRITSGLGEATPGFIVIVPIKTNDQIEGVLEIAAFRKFPDHHVRFLEKVCEGFASVIRSAKVSEETKALLDTSQNQMEELRAQEEEMRQNMEELHATQEAMERKTKEADEHSGMLKAIFDSSEDAILTIHENGSIETVNKTTLALFGYPEADLVGQNISSILPEVNQKIGRQSLRAYLHSGESERPVARGRKKEGVEFPVELAVNEAWVGSHHVFTCIIHDISRRVKSESERQAQLAAIKKQEEDLRQNLEQLQTIQKQTNHQLVENERVRELAETRGTVLGLTTILSETDLRGVITYVNEKFCEVSQYKSEELIGKPQNIVRHPDMPADLFRLMWETIKQENVFHGIIKNRAKDGSAYWVDATLVPIKGNDGKIVKYVGARYHLANAKIAESLYNQQADRFHWPRLHEFELQMN
jgi:methyl-accepting chemotaxis protein